MSVGAHSALAEAEVEYHDKKSLSIDVRFTPQDPAALARLFDTAPSCPVSVVIWTTTPWTLPGNQAVAVNPELRYALVQCELGAGAECIVIAEAMVESVMQRYGVEAHQVLGTCSGANLEHTVLKHPFYSRDSLMVMGDYVTTEAGTGCVHTAPDHGVDDFNTGKNTRWNYSTRSTAMAFTKPISTCLLVSTYTRSTNICCRCLRRMVRWYTRHY